ncbi:histidine kinase [Paenibacillus dakarensis]|uniref:histidine kinase n=1 Tax=Paenibacillus dakarensis TaxID=1527293 RepID=UPI001478663B|nr:histidine kinase [Paenibacillus dakarensis]
MKSIKLRKRLSSIYAKLIASFLIVLVPVYMISLAMNEEGEASVRREIENSMNSRVSFYIRLLENEFSRIIQMEKEFINDRQLRRLSFAASIMDDVEFREAVYAINARLKTMMNSNNYIMDADVFLPEQKRIVSAIHFYDKIPGEEYEALRSVSSRNQHPFVFWNNRLFVSFPYSDLALINDEDPIFLVSAEISQNQIRDVLKRLKIGSSGGAMLIGQDGLWSVSTDPDIEMLQASLSLLRKQREKEEGGGPSDNGGFTTAEIKDKKHWIAYHESPQLGISLLMYMPEGDMLGSQARNRVWFWLLSGFSIVVSIWFSYWIFRQIHLPIKRLVRAFQRVEDGNLNIEIKQKRSDEFYYLYQQFNGMVRRINELIHEVYEQKYRANLSELRQLQSQINPHFLYNSFFVLSRMAKYEDYESISRLSDYLGSYFRFVTRTHSDEVPLVEEVNYARTYVQIQDFRFEDRIRIDFDDLPDAFHEIGVPRLIVQPVVENVYEHGLKNKVRDGLIRVNFHKKNEHLIIMVEDNGEGMTEEELQQLTAALARVEDDMETTGLVNVNRRLKLRYGPTAGLELHNIPDGGLRVEIKIPLTKEENDVQYPDRG